MPGPTPQSKANRQLIIAALRNGETPFELAKTYPKATVYRIYQDMASGKLDENADEIYESEETPVRHQIGSKREAAEHDINGMDMVTVKEETAKSVDGDMSTITEIAGGMDLSAIKAVRGTMGILTRPKILSMPTPELLYTAEVISIQKWGWTPMLPNDFIDTALDCLIRHSGYEVPAYIDMNALRAIVKFANEHGYNGNNGGNGNNGNGNGHKPTPVVTPPTPTTPPPAQVTQPPPVQPQPSTPPKAIVLAEILPEGAGLKQFTETINEEITRLSEQSGSLVTEDKPNGKQFQPPVNVRQEETEQQKFAREQAFLRGTTKPTTTEAGLEQILKNNPDIAVAGDPNEVKVVPPVVEQGFTITTDPQPEPEAEHKPTFMDGLFAAISKK